MSPPVHREAPGTAPVVPGPNLTRYSTTLTPGTGACGFHLRPCGMHTVAGPVQHTAGAICHAPCGGGECAPTRPRPGSSVLFLRALAPLQSPRPEAGCCGDCIGVLAGPGGRVVIKGGHHTAPIYSGGTGKVRVFPGTRPVYRDPSLSLYSRYTGGAIV